MRKYPEWSHTFRSNMHAIISMPSGSLFYQGFAQPATGAEPGGSAKV